MYDTDIPSRWPVMSLSFSLSPGFKGSIHSMFSEVFLVSASFSFILYNLFQYSFVSHSVSDNCPNLSSSIALFILS
jgi:hypothetical protein